MTNKQARLLQLTRRRQATRWEAYKCIGDYHESAYECDFVSPYTKSAYNVDSELMVVLQDWASDDVLSGPVVPERLVAGQDAGRRTNQRLRELLQRHFGLQLAQIYATNVFPFIKLGPTSASIARRDLVRAAREFAVPQIEIVGPRLAVCLGKAAFDAVAVATYRRPSKSLAGAIASPFEIGDTLLWCQAHTGPLGTNFRNRGGVDRVEGDWAAMAAAYDGRVKLPGPDGC